MRRVEEARDFVLERTACRPTVGVLLGSGLGTIAGTVRDAEVIPYAAIPHFPAARTPARVAGHLGRLVVGSLASHAVAVMQGRVHFYEGYGLEELAFPVRLLHALGVGTLLVTNAAGALNPAYEPGDIMLITDHINLMGLTGHNPLRGPNRPHLGPRFPEMTSAYDQGLLQLARRAARRANLRVHEGIYACVAGPSYETPAEVRFLRCIGADAVGMSTAPEVTVARHAGMRVLAASGIMNLAPAEAVGATPPSHDEVLAVGTRLAPRMADLLTGVLGHLA